MHDRNDTKARIVAEARSWIGTPYRHQASLKGVGADCFGLVRGVWRAVIGPEPEPVPPYTPEWAEAGGGEALLAAARRHLLAVSLDEAAPGDVLLFRFRAHAPAKHCAILASSGTMIHAHDGAAVAEVSLARWWTRHRAAAFAFPAFDGA